MKSKGAHRALAVCLAAVACTVLAAGAASGVEPLAGSAVVASASAASGGCLEGAGGSDADGAQVVLAACDAGAAQRWTAADGTLKAGARCLQAAGEDTAAGIPVELWTCDGGAGQEWTAVRATLVNIPSGQCLDDPSGPGAVDVALTLRDCDGSPGQRWSLAAAPSSPVAPWLPAVLVALIPFTLGVLVLLPGPRRRASLAAGRVRARLPSPPARVPAGLRLLGADPATFDGAFHALAAVGGGPNWWPYAAAVSERDVTVWLAGIEVPEPSEPWSPVPGDTLAWTADRSVLAESSVESSSAELSAETGGSRLCLVRIGVLDDAVVLLDVSQSHGVLVVGGDPRQARRVWSFIRAQVQGGEVLVRGDGPHPAAGRPHWSVDADIEGWITVHGRRVRFADLTPPVAHAGPPATIPPRRPPSDERPPGGPVSEQQPPIEVVAVSADHEAEAATLRLPGRGRPRAAPASGPRPNPEPEARSEPVWGNTAVSGDAP